MANRVGEGQTGSTPSPMPHFRVPPLLSLLCIGLQHKILFKERMFFSLKEALEKFFLKNCTILWWLAITVTKTWQESERKYNKMYM